MVVVLWQLANACSKMIFVNCCFLLKIILPKMIKFCLLHTCIYLQKWFWTFKKQSCLKVVLHKMPFVWNSIESLICVMPCTDNLCAFCNKQYVKHQVVQWLCRVHCPSSSVIRYKYKVSTLWNVLWTQKLWELLCGIMYQHCETFYEPKIVTNE